MPVQFVPGAMTSSQALSTGLKSAMERLAQMQVQNLQQQKQADLWGNILGNPQAGQMLSGASPDQLKAILNNPALLERLQGLGSPQQQMMQPGMEGQVMQPQGPSFAQRVAEGAKSPALRLQEQNQAREDEKFQYKKQRNQDEDARKFFEEKEKKIDPLRGIYNSVNKAMSIMDDPKAQTGLKGKFIPEYLRNEITQQLDTVLNSVVLKKAAAGTGGGKGVMSKARLALEQLAKPAIWQNQKALRKNLNDILQDPDMRKALAEDKAIREAKAQFRDGYPKDIEQIVEERSKFFRRAGRDSEFNKIQALKDPSKIRKRVESFTDKQRVALLKYDRFLKYPAFFQEGAEIQGDNGVNYRRVTMAGMPEWMPLEDQNG